MKLLARFIYFQIMGWKVSGIPDPSIKKCVLIVAPHTSWWDFFLGLLIRKIMNMEAHFVGKKELFKPPFGWFFRWMGGSPINRGSKENKVEAIAALFEKKEIFRLGMSPEGTRKKTDRWKTGFYYIAEKAQVPIIMVAFDYAKKMITFSEPFYTNGNLDLDLAEIESFYDGVVGKFPDKF